MPACPKTPPGAACHVFALLPLSHGYSRVSRQILYTTADRFASHCRDLLTAQPLLNRPTPLLFAHTLEIQGFLYFQLKFFN